MSDFRPHASQLPANPNLRHLKDQAKDLLRSGEVSSLALALLQTARQYGFQSWPKLRAHVLAQTLAGALKEAIDRDDLAEVRQLLSRHQALRKAPIGYGGDGPLTWAAECRGMEQPSMARLELVRWLISTGSEVEVVRAGEIGSVREGFGLLGGEVWEVELGEDEAVEVAYSADLGADFVGRSTEKVSSVRRMISMVSRPILVSQDCTGRASRDGPLMTVGLS